MRSCDDFAKEKARLKAHGGSASRGAIHQRQSDDLKRGNLLFSLKHQKKRLTKYLKRYIINNVRGEKPNDRKGGELQMNNNENEAETMTNGETLALLEAVKIIIERADTKEEEIEAINRIQSKIKEPTSRTK